MKKYPVPSAILKDLNRVERAIERALAAHRGILREPAQHTVQAGGKRLRPALTLIAGLAGRYNYERLEPVAVAVELLHTATLVHDDVLDNADTRRGRPTVNGLWNDAVAVATGNVLLAKAFQALCGVDHPEAMSGLTAAARELSRGETMQQRALRNPGLTVEGYTDRVKAKTASLFTTCCGFGAFVSGAADADVAALKQYGEYLGVAFQIYDDILDFVADEDKLGKAVGTDVRDGTVTLPMIYALEADPSGKIREAISSETPTDEQVNEVVRLVARNGAVDRARADAAGYIGRACSAVEDVRNPSLRKNLNDIGKFVISRYN